MRLDKLKFWVLLTTLASFLSVSCESKFNGTVKNSNSVRSLLSFRLVGDFYYNSAIIDSDRIKNTYSVAQFNGRQYVLEYSLIDGVDINDLLKSVTLTFGHRDSSGRFISEPVEMKEFLKEFTLKYNAQINDSPILILYDEYINSCREYIAMKKKYQVGYENSSDFDADFKLLGHISSMIYFVSGDGNVLVECNTSGVENEHQGKWSVLYCRYYYIEDWKNDMSERIETNKSLASILVSQNQRF